MTGWSILAGSLIAVTGCAGFPKAEAESTAAAGRAAARQAAAGPVAVNVVVAAEGTLREEREYTGTTQPFRLISLRSQVEGQLLNLNVRVGDPIQRGQLLAKVDGVVLTTNVAEAEAEVAARESDVAQARIEVSDAQSQVKRTQAELQQAQSDLSRLQYLYSQGAIPQQQVEQARTQVRTAQALLQSAQDQVRTRRQAITAVQKRVVAQQAVVARERQRQSYAALKSPVTGSVVEQPIEPGSLVQPGTEVLKLGDFSQLKVAVQLSELELGDIRLGQSVQVKLDALPNQSLTGRVSRISPAADPVSRQVPIEITIPNSIEGIGSGLLARVNLDQSASRSRVLIPETALETGEDRKKRQGNGGVAAERNAKPRGTGTVFVIEGSEPETKVAARSVTLGQRGDGQVEVLSGLQTGERFVVRSSGALKNGDAVRLSILSEPSGQS